MKTGWLINALFVVSTLLGCTAQTSQGPAPAQTTPPPAAPPPSAPPPAGPPPVASGQVVNAACPELRGNGQPVAMTAGRYRCDVVITGNDNELSGAGPGQTILEGSLQVRGNGNRVFGLTVLGTTDLSGNSNDLRGTELQGPVQERGRGNHR